MTLSALMPSPLAAFPGELIIWIIVFIFWIIGSINQKAKENKQVVLRKKGTRTRRPRTPVPEDDGRQQESPYTSPVSPQEELENLLEHLGVEIEVEEREEAPPPRRPSPPPRTVSAPIEIEGQYEPIRFEKPPPPPKPEDTEDHSYDLPAVEAYEEIKDVAELERELEGKALTDVQALVRPSSFLVKLNRMNIPLMRTQMLSQRPVKTQTTPPDMKNKDGLRNALISRILLEPPKAFADPGEDLQRTGI